MEAVINVQRSSGAAPTPTVVLSSKDAKAAASFGVARAGDVPANELYLSAIGDGGGGALGESTAFYDGDWKRCGQLEGVLGRPAQV